MSVLKFKDPLTGEWKQIHTIRGEKGDKGDKGGQGADGYTPQKGTDYWTEADKKEIIFDVENNIKETLETKVDKTTEAYKIYGTNAKGDQTTFMISINADSSTIVQRHGNGQIPVPAQPADATCATSKEYVDTEAEKKLDKTTEASGVYGTDKDGNQKLYKASNTSMDSGTIPLRLGGGYIQTPKPTQPHHCTNKEYVDTEVAKKLDAKPSPYSSVVSLYMAKGDGTQGFVQIGSAVNQIVQRVTGGHINLPDVAPTSNKHAASKKYVDDKHIAIEKRVSELESLTLSYPKITSTDYEKIVPADVGKFALLRMMGGATEKVVSKNEINPAKTPLKDTSDMATLVSQNLNADGTITYTVLGPSVYVYVDLPALNYPVGRYYIYVNEPHNWFGMGEGNIEINCSADIEFNEELGYEDYIETTRTLELMIWQDTSVTTDVYEIVNAPEGTVFEPYFEPYFKNAEVTKVESIGANLFDGSLIKEESKSGLTIQYDQETQTFTINGTATESTSYSLTYINLKGEKGQKYVTKSEIVGGAIDIPSGKYAVAYFGVADEPNTSSNWQSLGLRRSASKITTLNNEYITAFWFYIETGVSLSNLQVKIMLAKADSDIPYKPYSAKPIDSITIPVEAIKAKTEVKDFSKGIDSTDYNYIECIDDKKQYVQVCKEIVLTGAEKTITTYPYNNMAGVSIYSVLDTNYNRAKAICTDTDKTSISNTTINSMWLGVNGNKMLYWIGILDYLGLSTIDEFRTYLANRYANGNPVRIIYKLATPIVTDITDIFPEDSSIEVQSGGVLRFVNEHKIPVPNTVGFIARKGG